ncbi:MAG: acyl-CoA dehydrogenase family protein, partial [Pseudomonadota bacterium]
MDFELSDERRMLTDTANRFIADRYPIATRHSAAAMEAGYNPAMWSEFAELGLIGALLPPEAGGFGGRGEDIAVVFEALGKGLVVEPFLASGILGATPLYANGGSQHRDILERVVEGAATSALAHGEPQARYTL